MANISCFVELQMKKSLKGQEEVSNEVVGAARVEAAGMSLFEYADKEDRRGSYHKSVMMLIIAEINIIFFVFQKHGKGVFHIISHVWNC